MPDRTLRLREIQGEEIPHHEHEEDLVRCTKLRSSCVSVAVDDSEDHENLVGLSLQGTRYELTRFIRRDNHAKVYSVVDWLFPCSPWTLEARAYLFTGLTSRYAQYKRRNMQRLSKRSVLTTQQAGHTIVVYTASSPLGLHHPPSRPDSVPKTTGSHSPDRDIHEKDSLTVHGEDQREKLRLKQRNKRLLRRTKKRAFLEGESEFHTIGTMRQVRETKEIPPRAGQQVFEFLHCLYWLSSPAMIVPMMTVDEKADCGLASSTSAHTQPRVVRTLTEELLALIQEKEEEVRRFAKHLAISRDIPKGEVDASSAVFDEWSDEDWDWCTREEPSHEDAVWKDCEEIVKELFSPPTSARPASPLSTEPGTRHRQKAYKKGHKKAHRNWQKKGHKKTKKKARRR
jgi:hypothetical protein